jgi:hypothetical protein
MTIRQQGGVFGRNPVFNSIEASQWVGVPRNVASSGVQSGVTGTTDETTLATFTLPAGSMGANGWLRLRTQTSQTNNTNNKTFKVYMGGEEVTNSTAGYTDSSSTSRVSQVWNRGAENSQVSDAKASINDPSETAAPLNTFSVDTSADVTILITGRVANASDELNLEAYSLEVCYIP